MKQLDFHIRGLAPLILHNAQLSDPLNEWTKAIAEISGKRKKTEADLIEMGRREFLGSMYTNAKGHPVVPETNLERMLRDAAAKSKEGKTVQAGLLVMDAAPIIYDGPKDPEKLWELHGVNSGGRKHALRASCKVGQSRVIRTRPWFEKWELKFSVTIDDTVIRGADTVRGFLELAGRVVGLGDWRPKHGRFEVL